MFGNDFCIEDIDTAPKEGRPPTEAELKLFFLPYRGYCARKGVSNIYFNYFIIILYLSTSIYIYIYR